MKNGAQGFGPAYWATLRALLGDTGALLLAVAAPVLYAFFYPWPYLNGVVQRVPVAVVDQDGSGLSRQLTRFVSASPKLQLALVTGDEQEARAALARREIEGYALLPRGLKQDVAQGAPVVVPVLGDGAYFLLNKTVLAGFGEVIATVSAGIETRRLQARGQAAVQAAAARSPLVVQLQALYNPTEGYGHYVVPAVAVVIVHQTLLMAVALWVGTAFEAARRSGGAAFAARGVVDWLARGAAFATLGLASGAWFFGVVFHLFGYGGGGDLAAQAVLLGPMVISVAALGTALGALVADRERPMQLLLFTSVPLIFLSGTTWPREALAPPLQMLGDLLPTTPAVQGLLRVNQMGATLADIAPQARHGAVLALGACALAAAVLVWRRRSPAGA